MREEMKWKGTTVADHFDVEMPEFVEPVGGQGVDSAVVAFEGGGVSVMIDHGPFSDPLTRYLDRLDHRSVEATIGGRHATVVSFTEPDGTRFVGAHFSDAPGPGGDSGPLTLAARAGRTLPAGVPERIVHSVGFRPD